MEIGPYILDIPPDLSLIEQLVTLSFALNIRLLSQNVLNSLINQIVDVSLSASLRHKLQEMVLYFSFEGLTEVFFAFKRLVGCEGAVESVLLITKRPFHFFFPLVFPDRRNLVSNCLFHILIFQQSPEIRRTLNDWLFERAGRRRNGTRLLRQSSIIGQWTLELDVCSASLGQVGELLSAFELEVN